MANHAFDFFQALELLVLNVFLGVGCLTSFGDVSGQKGLDGYVASANDLVNPAEVVPVVADEAGFFL